MSLDSVSSALGDRKVLPRWRAPSESLDELAAVHTPQAVRPRAGWLEKLIKNFEHSPNISSGRELLESTFVLGVELPADLHREIIETGYVTPLLLNKQNFDSNSPSNLLDPRQSISSLRAALKQDPRQPLAWTELARYYLSSGSAGKAEKAMQCALALAPESRYVLRSAARFFELIGDPEQALYALKQSGRLLADPWLLSADIALDGDRHSNSIKVGIRMLEGSLSTPRSLTELAAAIGTVEHESGRHKLAKKMFAQSLVDPNENSIAQAFFISQRDNKIMLPEEILNRPLTYEARARRSFTIAEWGDSMQQSWQWLKDEPFDTRPAVLGSCLSFDINLAQQAHDIATKGLSCLPNDSLLLNNRAVANAYLGRLDAAFSDVSHALRPDADRAYILATIGLIAYRSGDIVTGTRAYGMSIAWLVEQKDRNAVIRAYLYWLREAVRAGQTDGVEEIETVRKIVDKLPLGDASEVPGLMKAVEDELDMRRNGRENTLQKPDFNEEAIRQLEEKVAIPEEAKKIYPLIAKDKIPEINQAERFTLK